MKAWSRLDSNGRCKTWAEKKEAILDPAASASGWYGPGAYLAWLITAYVTALSTIWHSKCSRQHPDVNKVDAEVLLTLGYPLIAMVDVVARLIRCQIDPEMSAAAFVLVSSLTIVGPLTRLSWQEDGADMAVEPVFYPVTVKEWTWKTMRFLCHTVVYAILFEPQIPIPKKINEVIVGGILHFSDCLSESQGSGEPDAESSTEPTGKALNSEETRSVVGAWEIASGFSDIEGLAIDLGRGRMQVTYIASHGGSVNISPKGSISFPYGAAALTQKWIP
ncbi:hypothetical protein ETB97_007829 [Aspergillus alliaceus]|uniref:Uncharacterized protein n=1 Tax=Petromyces alliaceus TaxID=209559 RepID=A0A8H5ZW19_PETAA|nr:hypothetical protein ETB97_007829 [Aspergillus burnettii]